MECDCCDGREPATLAEVNALVKGIVSLVAQLRADRNQALSERSAAEKEVARLRRNEAVIALLTSRSA